MAYSWKPWSCMAAIGCKCMHRFACACVSDTTHGNEQSRRRHQNSPVPEGEVPGVDPSEAACPGRHEGTSAAAP